MRFLLCVCTLSTLINLSSAMAGPNTNAVGPFDACATVVGVQSGGYIYKNSAPVRSGGLNTPIVGYRKEPTLIMLRNTSNRKTTRIFAANGVQIGSCPWASAEGTFGGRFRCTMGTASLRRKAVKAAESPTIYIRLKPQRCVEVADAGRCYGSTKGLCNQVIR